MGMHHLLTICCVDIPKLCRVLDGCGVEWEDSGGPVLGIRGEGFGVARSRCLACESVCTAGAVGVDVCCLRNRTTRVIGPCNIGDGSRHRVAYTYNISIPVFNPDEFRDRHTSHRRDEPNQGE